MDDVRIPFTRPPIGHVEGSPDVPSFTRVFDTGFDTRWATHPKPQATTLPMWEAKVPWERGDLKGKMVLDAGCGIGRFVDLALLYGADSVIGVDVSPHALATADAQIRQAGHLNTKFIQASLLDIPFEPQTFDCAYSLGVLHHTVDPRAAFMEVADKVKIGGELAVWLYMQPIEDRWMPALELFHAITKACDPARLHSIFEEHCPRVRDSYAGVWEPISQLMRVSNSMDDEECISDTFDWHAPRYRSWHTFEQVEAWFAEAGYKVTSDRDTFPVTVWGVRVR